jgi:DNA polymerase-3 subunit delta
MAPPKGAPSSKSPPSVAYLAGEERLLVEDALERHRASALENVQVMDFNHDRVSARSTGAQAMVNLCRTLPVMSPRRLVEVRDAEAIAAADHPLLLEYVRSPDPACTLLLVGDKADMRMNFFKELNTRGVLFIFSRVAEKELPGFVEQRSRRHQISLTREAVECLAVTIGSELMLLDRALEKLRLVVGDNGVVDEAAVAEHVAVTRMETSFKIVEAIAAGRPGEALTIMLTVVGAGEPALRLLGALAYAQRQSILMLGLLDQGLAPFEAARQARVFRNADKVAARVRAAGACNLAEGLCAIADADRALKSSVRDDESVLTELIFRLAVLQVQHAPARAWSAPPGQEARR